ncbi:MAG: ubiquinol-cytochrome c reductase iron-sulfur subunit [Prochlorothrix sp.]
MNRREFVNWIGVGTLASSLPAVLAACQSETASPPPAAPAASTAPAPREDGFASIGSVAELDEAGSLSSLNFQGKQVVVARDPANPDVVVALDSLCTHQGCTVTWDAESFACPCHGSSFNLDGTVAAGPASSPLPVYEAKIEGDQVLVKATA